MPEFRIVGPNPSFHPLERNADSLRDALENAKAELIRQAIGFGDPLLSASLFQVSFKVQRLVLVLESSTNAPFFAVDITIAPGRRFAPELAAEARWFDKKFGGNPLTQTFLVYGDDPNEI